MEPNGLHSVHCVSVVGLAAGVGVGAGGLVKNAGKGGGDSSEMIIYDN